MIGEHLGRGKNYKFVLVHVEFEMLMVHLMEMFGSRKKYQLLFWVSLVPEVH